MMRILLLLLSTFTLLPSCTAVEVKQDKKLVIEKTGNKVQLSCKQDQSNYINMFWYQQKPEQGLKLMVYSVDANSEDMEKDYKEQWSIKRPTVYDSTLTLNASDREDSAVYFCASTGGRYYQAYFGEGTVLSVIGENEKIKGPKVSIYRPNKRELEVNKFISLVCVASGFFPEHVKIRWYVNDVERINLYEPVPLKNTDNSYATSKRLTLTSFEYYNPNSVFRCEAAFLDDTHKVYKEVRGETDCGVSKETFSISIYLGKISYIMVLCKSGLYALVVLVLLWRKKVIAGSF